METGHWLASLLNARAYDSARAALALVEVRRAL
jgi:hypothetical protein